MSAEKNGNGTALAGPISVLVNKPAGPQFLVAGRDCTFYDK